MVLLIPFAIAILILSLVSVVYVGIQCASVSIPLCVIMIAVAVIIFALFALLGIRKTVKTNKPYYLISAVLIFLIGIVTFAFQNQIIDFATSTIH